MLAWIAKRANAYAIWYAQRQRAAKVTVKVYNHDQHTYRVFICNPGDRISINPLSPEFSPEVRINEIIASR